MTSKTVWTYRGGIDTSADDLALRRRGRDGSIGKIDQGSTEVNRQYLVVDTGFWIFGKKRLIPAGMVTRVDPTDRRSTCR